MQKHLFLDLEDTVICPVASGASGWTTSFIINEFKIKNFIEDTKPDHFHIFSFALHDEREINGFINSLTKKSIEDTFKIKLELLPTVEHMISVFCRENKLAQNSVSLIDFIQLVGKQNAFRAFVRNQFRNATEPVEIMLLDDVVFNESFSFDKIKGNIFNIDKLRI